MSTSFITFHIPFAQQNSNKVIFSPLEVYLMSECLKSEIRCFQTGPCPSQTVWIFCWFPIVPGSSLTWRKKKYINPVHHLHSINSYIFPTANPPILYCGNVKGNSIIPWISSWNAYILLPQFPGHTFGKQYREWSFLNNTKVEWGTSQSYGDHFVLIEYWALAEFSTGLNMY